MPFLCTANLEIDVNTTGPLDPAATRIMLRELLERLEWFPKLNEARQAALVSMAYQMGTGGLFSFRRTLASIGSGDYEKASREMLDSKWARQTPARAQRTAYMMRYGKFPTI